MKLHELTDKKNKVFELLLMTGWSNVSKFQISDNNVSVHGTTRATERKDFVQPIIDIFGKDNISFLAFTKNVEIEECECDADGNIEEDEEGNQLREMVDLGYSSLYFSFKKKD